MEVDIDDYSEEIEIGDEDMIDILLSAKIFDDNYLLGPLLVSGINRAVFEGDIDAVKLMVESGVSVNTEDRQFGFTPLHMAVVANSLDILEYLLSQDDVSVNAQSENNLSPLHVAAALGYIELVRKLTEAGADVNLQDCRGNTPLKSSVQHPEVAHLLIQKGTDIENVSRYGTTALHDAVLWSCLETVCMLLYYNADAEVRDDRGITPFVDALSSGELEIQQALFEYVIDFKEPNVLYNCLKNDVRLIDDILKRGVDINNTDRSCGPPSLLAATVQGSWTQDVFKLIWDQLRYDKRTSKFTMLDLFEADEGLVEGYLQVIIESDNFAPAVDSLTAKGHYGVFIEKFARDRLKLEQLMVFTCRLLQYGYRATSLDVSAIFYYYGFCELLRILLYMDIDCTKGWPIGAIIPRMMFDLHYELQESIIVQLERPAGVRLLEYFTCPQLPREWRKENEKRGELPSLTELARGPARRHIWDSLAVKSTCQFYTFIDGLSLSSEVEKILTFKSKLYSQ